MKINGNLKGGGGWSQKLEIAGCLPPHQQNRRRDQYEEYISNHISP